MTGSKLTAEDVAWRARHERTAADACEAIRAFAAQEREAGAAEARERWATHNRAYDDGREAGAEDARFAARLAAFDTPIVDASGTYEANMGDVLAHNASLRTANVELMKSCGAAREAGRREGIEAARKLCRERSAEAYDEAAAYGHNYTLDRAICEERGDTAKCCAEEIAALASPRPAGAIPAVPASPPPAVCATCRGTGQLPTCGYLNCCFEPCPDCLVALKTEGC